MTKWDPEIVALAKVMYDETRASEAAIRGRDIRKDWDDAPAGLCDFYCRRAEFIAGLLKEAETQGRIKERASYEDWYLDIRGHRAGVHSRYSRENPLD